MAKNYVLVYHGGAMPETETAQAQAMQAWDDWFGRLGPALVDGPHHGLKARALRPALLRVAEMIDDELDARGLQGRNRRG